jgi:hypothetical protein
MEEEGRTLVYGITWNLHTRTEKEREKRVRIDGLRDKI